MIPPAAFALAAIALAVPYLFLIGARESWPRSIIKTLPVALLAVASWQSPLLCLALGLGALGDMLLSRRWGFEPGLAAFLTSHLLYIALMLPLGQGMPVLGAALVLASGAALGVMMFARAGPLRWPVAAYVAVILAMALAALATRRAEIVVPALFFVASDALLGAEKFLLADAQLRRLAALSVWPLYIAAQGGLFLAFFPGAG